MILFLSKYPETASEFRDGFFQRVVDIDGYFTDKHRIYLNISLLKNHKKYVIDEADNMRKIYYLNFFLHLFLIIRMFNNAEFVYIQSLHNTLYSFPFIKLITNKYVLDLHGVVPEELEFQQRKLKSWIFHKIEHFIFGRIDICVAVTARLANHYKEKYPACGCQYIIYNILPKNLRRIDLRCNEDEKVHIIYSGNTQAWQNIELMLSVISNNQFPNFKYTILTGDLEGMKDALEAKNLFPNANIELNSVSPQDLTSYYAKANYGFILRDDILVNNVACPTKLVEYMFYGIIPIVLSDNIGDFRELGYERIHYSELHKNIPMAKSHINQLLIEQMIFKNQFAFKKIFFNDRVH